MQRAELGPLVVANGCEYGLYIDILFDRCYALMIYKLLENWCWMKAMNIFSLF